MTVNLTVPPSLPRIDLGSYATYRIIIIIHVEYHPPLPYHIDNF